MRDWCALLFYSVFLFGCADDAPRDNPLDSHSLNYVGEGGVTGRAIIVKLTIGGEERTGVEGVNIFHVGSGIFVTTDSSGYFSLNNLQEGTHTFICSKKNFTNDTFQVQIQPQALANVTRALNGAPVTLSQTILTRKIDYVSFSPKYFVDIEADVTDPNGINDLKLVWFQTRDSLFEMDYDNGLGKFTVSLDKLNFPTNTIQWLTAESLHIVSKDGSGAINASNPFSISRIIENSSTPLSPSFDTIPPNSLIMKWKPPDITFNYTSTVTIYFADTKDIIATYPNIISFNEQYPPIDGGALSIDGGDYFWTVTIVDEFGNYSRSKEAYFTVDE